MTAKTIALSLPNEDATALIAGRIAPLLQRGDVVLLSGPIGAGKSAFARAVIRARLGRMEEVPSPTFTLVQTYPDPYGDIWHSDLYRLSGPDEAEELGLTEAFETAICLVEWPDRLGALLPTGALNIAMEALGDSHQITISANSEWAARLGTLDA